MAVMLAVSAAPARSAETATADDTARFLAGLPPSANSPLAPLTKDPFWQQHARYFDSIFAREDSAKLSKVRAFSKEYLTDKHDTMLYMFSGPDFLYATSFFPNASTYVLAGLEPTGDIPQLTNLSRSTVNGSLRNLEVSMGSLLSLSFFITKNMKVQLHEGPVFGTLPVLYALRSQVESPADARLRWLLEEADLTDEALLAEALTLLRGHHAVKESRADVLNWVHEARTSISALPDGPARAAFLALCHFVEKRTG